MHGKVPMGSEKPTDIVAILRHFFRVTAVKEGCARKAFDRLVHSGMFLKLNYRKECTSDLS